MSGPGGGGLGAPAALALRVLLVGLERVLLRRLAQDTGATEAAAAFFGAGALALAPWAALGGAADWSFLRQAVPSAMVYAVAYWLYVAAFRGAEVSAVAPLSAANAVFVVLLAALVHQEPLTPSKVAGALLIAGGGAALQLRRAEAPGLPARSAAAMLAYALLTAVTRMLDKAHAASAPGPPVMYAFTVFALVATCQAGLLAAAGGLGRLTALVLRRPGLVVASGLCNGGSFLLLLLALTRVPVSVAEPLTALSLLVSAAIAAVWFREPVAPRLLPTLAVVGGTWLLAGEGGLW
jgi:transporter family protein